MTELLPCDSPDFRLSLRSLQSDSEHLSAFSKSLLQPSLALIGKYAELRNALEEFLAAVTRGGEEISDQAEMRSVLKAFTDVFRPYLESWTALCESVSRGLVEQLQRQVDEFQSLQTLGDLFADSLADLDQLHKETLTFKRNYTESHPTVWQLHLGRIHSAEKRSELVRFDLYSRLKNYPLRWTHGVTEALAEFLFAHCAFLDSKALSLSDRKLSDFSDCLSTQKTAVKSLASMLATERQALEMELSLFSRLPQLRPGGRCGYMWKHGNLLKEWKRRFFFTKNHFLWYYRSGEEVKYADLSLSKAVENRLSDWPFAMSIISAKGTIDLLAESQRELDEWVYALNSLAEATLLGDSHSEEYRCADCTAKSAQWCSLSLGVMLCCECSGVHRSLGSHVSRVKSWQMDNLRDTTREVVRRLHSSHEEVWGTTKIAALTTRPERQTHIRQKYIEKVNFVPVSDPQSSLCAAISSVDIVSAFRCIQSSPEALQSGVRGSTFPHLAVAARSKVMLELLVLCGADLAVRDAAGLTVLDAALLTQETDLITFVLENLDRK